MFGFGNRRNPWCGRCRRPVQRCICRICKCGNGPVKAVLPEQAPAPLRIEPLTPLIVVEQPIEQPNLVNINEPAPSPKDAPDDWQEFDSSWMEND